MFLHQTAIFSAFARSCFVEDGRAFVRWFGNLFCGLVASISLTFHLSLFLFKIIMIYEKRFKLIALSLLFQSIYIVTSVKGRKETLC